MADKMWCPTAERIPGRHSAGGSMAGGPPRVVWHRTVGGTFDSNVDMLKAKGYEPHLLWDPWTGRIGQFIPANRSAYALAHQAGAIPETNRMGRYCIQIEVVDHGKTVNITKTPMRGVEHILTFLRGLGVPDDLPMGKMARLGHSGRRDPHIWASKAGHYGHCHVPGNDHSDPGRMDFRKIFGHDGNPDRPRTVGGHADAEALRLSRRIKGKRIRAHRGRWRDLRDRISRALRRGRK